LGYGCAALAWGVLAVLLLVRGSDRGLGRMLMLAVGVQTLWAALIALSLTQFALPIALVHLFDALRPFVWTALLIWMLKARAEPTPLRLGIALAASIALAQFLTPVLDLGAQMYFGFALVAAVLALLCVEQVYRNTLDSARWAIKFLCLAIFGIFVLEVVLLTDALLFGRLEYSWWSARGFANALLAPLIGVSAARMPDWRLDLRVSRKVVFHTATLLVSGIFLLAVSVIGYGLSLVGGEWGGVAQLVVIFAAAISVLALLASGNLRARARVMLAKHFFSYRYDYRAEWLKLTELIAQPDSSGEDARSLAQRSLQGLSDLVESPGSALWLRNDEGQWVCAAHHKLPNHPAFESGEPLIAFLIRTTWIVDIPEWQVEPSLYEGLQLPESMQSDPQAWLIVPLVLHDDLIGFVQLQKPVAPIALDWEVRDILKTAGRQVAGYLAVQETVEKLVQARQFDSFNRMSAFVVHDLKNLVAQLSLLLKNAARHRDNPEFQQDMLETIENVSDRMQALLLQLRVGAKPIEQAAPVSLTHALQAAIASKKGHPIEPLLHIDPTAEGVEVVAHRDRLERVVGHLIQNALEATPPGGTVRIDARCEPAGAVVQVIDSGRGMSRDFIETQLFKPFSSTKEHGMGVGAFESREYIREVGGSLAVESREGTGTTFTLRMPARPPAKARLQPSASVQH